MIAIETPMAFQRNDGPEYSLVSESWLPVLRRGRMEPELVSLETLFKEADDLTDLAEANPIVRASLLRFLISMTYLVIEEEGGNPKKTTSRAVRTGLSANAVDAVMGRWDHALWLFHPETPFFQDPRLAVDSSLRSPMGPLAVTPFLPGDSSSRWGVNLSAASGVSIDESARLLVTNWFYTPTGNSSRRTDPADSSIQSKRVLSAAGANFPTLSHFFRKGRSLLETLAGNLLTDYFPDGDAAAYPAFLQINDLTLNVEVLPPLYASTLSASTCLIAESQPGQTIFGENFLRGSTVLDGSYEAPADRLKKRSLAVDPHTLYKDNPKQSDNHPRFSVKGNFNSLPLFCQDLNRAAGAHEIISAGVFNKRETVLGRQGSPAMLEILQLEHGGNASGRLIAGASTYLVPADELGPLASSAAAEDDVAVRAEAVARVLSTLLAERDSGRIYLIQALKNTVGPKAKGLDSLADQARDRLLNETARSVATAVAVISRDGEEAFDSDTAYQDWCDATMRVFDVLATPFRESQSGSSRYWQQRGQLARRLAGTFGTYPIAG